MEDRNTEFRLSVWHGNRRKDIFTIQKWIDNVDKAKGTTATTTTTTTTTKPIGFKRNFLNTLFLLPRPLFLFTGRNAIRNII
jgi:hypothetical protein